MDSFETANNWRCFTAGLTFFITSCVIEEYFPYLYTNFNYWKCNRIFKKQGYFKITSSFIIWQQLPIPGSVVRPQLWFRSSIFPPLFCSQLHRPRHTRWDRLVESEQRIGGRQKSKSGPGNCGVLWGGRSWPESDTEAVAWIEERKVELVFLLTKKIPIIYDTLKLQKIMTPSSCDTLRFWNFWILSHSGLDQSQDPFILRHIHAQKGATKRSSAIKKLL